MTFLRRISAYCTMMLLVSCVWEQEDSELQYRYGFVDIEKYIPSVVLEIKYYGEDNFVGSAIDGYEAPKCLLTQAAARALVNVQMRLLAQDKSLKFFDCYRPQRAVDHFVRWAQNLDDLQTKSTHYPFIEKRNLFRDGYIAEQSGHSRGSTFDVTIIDRFTMQELDMGTGYDFFDTLSHTLDERVVGVVRQNRLLLRSMLEENGFKNLEEEWWHYTLIDEPYPDTFFEFPIQ